MEYCNGGDSGPVVGSVATITLSQSLATYGESINYGQIGQSLSASAIDCKGNSVSVSKYTYASTNGYTAGAAPGAIYADINPNTGQVCGGTWNRNSGGGVADYTTCTAPTVATTGYLAYVTATAEGATSNAIPVFVHPVANSIQLASQTTTSCQNDPTSDCCPLTYTAPLPLAAIYPGNVCLSQGQTNRLIARAFDASGTNITCQVGHLTFTPVGSTNIVSIDENGVATANQPGSATITASIAGSSSSSTAGFFSTCPPAAITLTSTNGKNPVVGELGVATPFTTSVTDTHGNPITGLTLTYESTTPQTIPGGSNSVTPNFPGITTITAVCEPPGCNPAPFSQIDYLQNGTSLTSNGIQFSDTGPSSTVLYVGSTSSQYIYPYDFTTNQPGALLKLPYTPNSMVISQDGTTIYLGSPQALMVVSATNNALQSTNTSITGSVISISPDGTTIIATDPVRQTTSLVSSSGAVITTENGVATRAAWSPDSGTVYIITQQSASYGPQLLVHNSFTAWTAIPLTSATAYSDVTVTVPHIGAYLAGPNTQGVSYCPTTNSFTAGTPPAVVNNFYPVAQNTGVANQRIAATNDSNHILAAENGTPAVLNDFASSTLPYTTPCFGAPTTVTPTFAATDTPHTLTGVSATAITGVVPATNSAAAFVTYTGSSTNAAGQLPLYIPASGTATAVKLSGAAVAPVNGVFSSDNSFFYVSTTGDNLVHIVTMTYPSSGAPTAVDTGTIAPMLPDGSGNIVTPNLIVQRPKKPTS